MTVEISKRGTIKYRNEDMVTDTVFGAHGNEYVVTASGKTWRDYDWILENFEASAQRMADYTHFVYLNNQDECTHSMVFDHAAQSLRERLEQGRPDHNETYNPKAGTVGSA